MGFETFSAIFGVSCKLELMKTMLETLIEIVKREDTNIPEQAMLFASRQKTIKDLLCITHDGICCAIQNLEEIQGGGAA